MGAFVRRIFDYLEHRTGVNSSSSSNRAFAYILIPYMHFSRFHTSTSSDHLYRLMRFSAPILPFIPASLSFSRLKFQILTWKHSSYQQSQEQSTTSLLSLKTHKGSPGCRSLVLVSRIYRLLSEKPKVIMDSKHNTKVYWQKKTLAK